MRELLTFAAGYGTCLLTLVGAYYLGRRLKRIVEVTTIPAPTAPNEWSQDEGFLTHVGAEGAMHRGHIRSCGLCAKIRKSRKA